MSHPSSGIHGSVELSLGGILSVLRSHSAAPHAFLRELLRLAASSVAARDAVEPAHAGEIHLQLVEPQGGGPPTLLVEDNGIGLSEGAVLHGPAKVGGFCRSPAAEGQLDEASH